MNPTLQTLLQRSDIWRAKTGTTSTRPKLSTGWATLDRALQGGWPSGALIELLLEQTGSGELRLLMPLFREHTLREHSFREHTFKELARNERNPSTQPQQQVWIDPPLLPYAPALRQYGVPLDTILIVRPADRMEWLWSCVQALRVGRQVTVLCWPNRHRLRYADLRQLQVTASEYGSQGFLLRDLAHDRRILQHSTPAPLRLHLASTAAALNISVLKQRGNTAGQQILLPHERALQPPIAPSQRARIAAKILQPRTPTPAGPSVRTEVRRL